MAKSTTLTDEDRTALRRALDLAERGRGRVSPNPLVGAVLVRDGRTIGEGHHAELGGLHAETAALEDCRARGEDPRAATAYMTLEPCAHHGRQPPCAEALVAAGIARAVIASDDPSEHASGRGPAALEAAGVEVSWADGAEAAAARLLNQPFRKRARTGRPLVTLKSAISLDGRTATAAGDSRWISGERSRALVHRWRAEADAVAVGIGTALADDPLLTARPDADPAAPGGIPASPESPLAGARSEDAAGSGSQPLRIVFDSAARLPLASRLVASLDAGPVVVVASAEAPAGAVGALREAGVEVLTPAGERPARIAAALSELGGRGVSSLILEGGAALAGAFLDAGEVDELRLFLAPIVLGGDGARPLAGGEGTERVGDAPRATDVSCERSGEDLLISARLRDW
jgi:diaminohydroxyphosphoribosylaminopyrimidine deaminase / 5-amino-6-(5-phosphoribosylamino)uracil reductase